MQKNLPCLHHWHPKRHRFLQRTELQENQKLISQEPLTSTEDSISETPVCQVQPVLGMTPIENLQLCDRNQLEDIADILGTTAFKGYVHTPIQTLDGIYIQQPKRFLPLAEEAKH